MRWDYSPLDINPVFPGLGEQLLLLWWWWWSSSSLLLFIIVINSLFKKVKNYNNSAYKNSYSFNRILIKVNELNKIEDENNKNVKKRVGSAKDTIFNIAIPKELWYESNTVSESSTMPILAFLWYPFLDCFFKTYNRFQRFYFVLSGSIG